MQLSLKTLIGSFDDEGLIADFDYCIKTFAFTQPNTPDNNDLTITLNDIQQNFSGLLSDYLNSTFGWQNLNRPNNLENFQIQVERKICIVPKTQNVIVAVETSYETASVWVNVIYEVTVISLNNKSGSGTSLTFAKRPLGQ